MEGERHPRKFSEEFKRQVVELYDNGKPTSEILEEYDLGSSTFHRWVRSIHDSGSTRAADNRTPEERELIDLRKENRQLKMENDILKQAALIFARRRRSSPGTPAATRYQRNAGYWASPARPTTRCAAAWRRPPSPTR